MYMYVCIYTYMCIYGISIYEICTSIIVEPRTEGTMRLRIPPLSPPLLLLPLPTPPCLLPPLSRCICI